jgi:hypothetical protein
MRPPLPSASLRRGDLLAAWNPGRPVAANLLFVLFVAFLELFVRDGVAAAGAGLERSPWLGTTFGALWLAYPLALHVKLPLIAEAGEAGGQSPRGDGWGGWLLVGGLLMSVLSLMVVITSFGLDLEHPLAPLIMVAGVGHGLAVAFLYLGHLDGPPGPLSWRRRWEWGADLVLAAYVCLAYAWIWEGLMTGRGPSLASYGWPAVIPQLFAAVPLFWIVYFPLQAPFLLRLSDDLRARPGGVWLFRASCLAATIAGLWPAFRGGTS